MLRGRKRYGLFALVTFFLIGTNAQTQILTSHPLASADTSSPRATLASFLVATDEALALELNYFRSYLSSGRLYPNGAENQLAEDAARAIARATETLDLSELPAGFREPLALEQVIRLTEILSRIEIPPLNAVPDRDAMIGQGLVRWTIPGTSIDIKLVETGARRGEYVFSADTLARLGELHELATRLPYVDGPYGEFMQGLRPYISARTLYDFYRLSNTGTIIPQRWMIGLPEWLTFQVSGISIWQWFGLALYILLGIGIAYLLWQACRLLRCNLQLRLFFLNGAVAIFAVLLIKLCVQIHISGDFLYVVGTLGVAGLYISLASGAVIGAGILAELFIGARGLIPQTIDSQLIRLACRLAGLLTAIGFLVKGAEQLGIPAYSVLTSLGIGGLAVAFAARETLANLFGSIVIMLEKTFRLGQSIRIGAAEGVVDHIGFRSTRIRTFEDTLLSIPNSGVVNSIIDNRELRRQRRQRFFIRISYQTKLEKVEAFSSGASQIIADSVLADKDKVHVHLNNFGDYGFEILVYFFLRTNSLVEELQAREAILLRVVELAEKLGIDFAAPQQEHRLVERPPASQGKTEVTSTSP
jgi:MscS family membrane protein